MDAAAVTSIISAEVQVVHRSDIQVVCDQIVRHARPHKVILFGSHAAGAAMADSDVDLLVILPFEGSAIQKEVEVSLGIRHEFPLDLLVRTPEQIAYRLSIGDPFIREIMEKGQVLYDAAGVGVGAVPTCGRSSGEA